MKRWLPVLAAVCMLLFCSAAQAEDVCFISNVPGEDGVTTGCSYLRLKVPVESESPVVLTIRDPKGRTVYQRDFGLRANSFRTEDIYLKLSGSSTLYEVTLQVGDTVYAFPVERVTGRLSGSAGCTQGLSLSDVSGVDGWRMATLLRVKDGETRVPVIAGGAYCVGEATFTVKKGKLTVSVQLDDAADGSVDGAKVFVATDAATAARLGRSKFPGLTGKLNKAIDLNDAPVAAVYVQLSLSFDPLGASPAPTDTDPEQEELWLQLLDSGESVG